MFTFRSNLPAGLEQAVASQDSGTENAGQGEVELDFAPCRCKEATPNPPYALVVTSDDEVCRKLAESLCECGLGAIFSSTVAESRTAMARREVFVVVCNEWLPDGSYLDVIKLVARSSARIPLIVISRTGDWPEYLRAIGAGAFDYVAYPPIRGDLQRAIRSALVWNRQNREDAV
jgi:DNA-binding NtrC family response regulator